MLGDFCKGARTKPNRKTGDECARLCRFPAFARNLDRSFRQSVTVTHIGHDLLERWGLALHVSLREEQVRLRFPLKMQIIPKLLKWRLMSYRLYWLV